MMNFRYFRNGTSLSVEAIATLIELNVPFSCFCVVLMHVRYKELFAKVCCLCTLCCSSAMRIKAQQRKDEKGMAVAIQTPTPTTRTASGIQTATNSSDLHITPTTPTAGSMNTVVQPDKEMVRSRSQT